MYSTALVIDEHTKQTINEYVPSEDIISDLSDFFSVFSDFTRLKIISALAVSEMCVTDIAVVTGINQTTVSHQLRFMRGLGAVTPRRNGKMITYALSGDAIGEILYKGIKFLGI